MPVPRRLLQSAGRAVRFALAAGHHSLAVLDEQPRSNRQLRRSMSECRLANAGIRKRGFLATPRQQSSGHQNPLHFFMQLHVSAEDVLPLPRNLVGTAEALQHGQQAYEEVAMHCCTL